jgi:hypothetical protein
MDELEHHTMNMRPCGDAVNDVVTIKLESCHSTWSFQPARKRFRRTLKDLNTPWVTTGWRLYYALRFDDTFDGFTVLLNPEGTRLLRSRCHQPGSAVCVNCAEDRTQEVPLDDLSQFVGR